MAISLPWGYFLTVGIWVVVHFQGHNFPSLQCLGSPGVLGYWGWLQPILFLGWLSFLT